MKLFITAAMAAMLFTSLPLAAQDSAALSGSAAQSGSISGSAAQGGNVTFNSSSARTQEIKTNPGTSKIKNTPGLGAFSVGGGHPCASQKIGGQLVLPGFGAGAGGMDIDEACMLIVMAASNGDPQAYAAAKYMMAARDPEACKAMYKAGMIADCVDSKGRSRVKGTAKQPTISSRSAPKPTSKAYASKASDER